MIRASSLLSLAIVVAAAPALAAQVPTDSVARRFRFAEMFVGADYATLFGGSADLPGGLPARGVPRVSIAGLHFWGYGDFAVMVPLGQGRAMSEGTRSAMSTGVETRGRWYPRSLARDGVSPFVGGGLGATDVEIGDGPRAYRLRPMVQAGLAWRRGQMLFDAGWSAGPRPTLDYPTARATTARVQPAGQAVWIGAHRLIETTASLENPVRSGAMARYESRLRDEGRLSGPSLAVGLSSLILTGATDYNRNERPWLAARPRGGAVPDLGLGWYFDGPDLQLNLAYRQGRFDTEAFAYRQENSRRSVALEAYRFLFDYHGFVPFVGPVVSYETLRVRERDAGVQVFRETRSAPSAGIVFGWDIRPTRAQPWLLRTNLRYFPNLRVPVPGGEQALDQLEFNFIQFVWYPGR
jgi:hypothetical protein